MCLLLLLLLLYQLKSYPRDLRDTPNTPDPDPNALAGLSRSLYVPDELGSMCPGLSPAPLPTRSGRAALLIGHGRGNRRFEPSLRPKPRARFFSPAQRIGHQPPPLGS